MEQSSALYRLRALAFALTITCAGSLAAAGQSLHDMATDFRRHCCQVHIQTGSFEGKPPPVGEFRSDIANERPTLLGGYWWDERHVVVADPILANCYIQNIEVAMPDNPGHFYPARVAGRFLAIPALLLEVLPDDNGLLPASYPLQADTTCHMDDTLSVLEYGWDRGEWRVTIKPFIESFSQTDCGDNIVDLAGSGIIVDADRGIRGLAFGNRVCLENKCLPWSGENLRQTPVIRAQDEFTLLQTMRDRLASTVLETRFQLRVHFEDDQFDSWSDNDAAAADIRAAGLVIGPKTLLVPVPLDAEAIARLESISVTMPDGREIPAEFVGALRHYLALVVRTEESLPFEMAPEGFAALNPSQAIPHRSPDRDRGMDTLFYRWHIDYALGRRRETVDYDRWLGSFRGFRGDPTVLTNTNEEDGTVAFDENGRLLAVALTPRTVRTSRSASSRLNRSRSPNSGFRRISDLAAAFREADFIDPILQPIDPESGRRLIDFGVEYQGLDANTAQLFAASTATRGGAIGLLVTHVYPNSMAHQAGIREHDILLRLTMDGRREPIELTTSYGRTMSVHDLEEMGGKVLSHIFGLAPPPWPDRDNELSGILTGYGVNVGAQIEYLREGEAYCTRFETQYHLPDYRNAPKKVFPSLGLTIKPLTYEAARYFRRDADSGVVISRVEDGGKASVAGLHPYLLITHVDGSPVRTMEEVAVRLNPYETGESDSLELTVESFGKTRLVRILR